MTQAAFKQSSHLNPELHTTAPNLEKLVGRWLNTNRETRGIAECTITSEAGQIRVSVVGVGDGGPVAWPTVSAHAVANLEEEAGQRTGALMATFDFEFMRAETHIRINKGVLVIVLFVTFLDESGRSNYLNREFFHLA
jgi:hypothetical protein